VARITRFRDPTTGRFVSESTANALENAVRLVYEGGQTVSEQTLSYGMVSEEVVGTVENWQQEPSRWGTRWHADEDPLDIYGVQQSAFPEGYDSFKVWYFVDGNPDYPRGYASGGWMGADQWPPRLDSERNFSPTGISQIVFRRG
jgi:hypothetical protein